MSTFSNVVSGPSCTKSSSCRVPLNMSETQARFALTPGIVMSLSASTMPSTVEPGNPGGYHQFIVAPAECVGVKLPVSGELHGHGRCGESIRYRGNGSEGHSRRAAVEQA